MPLEGFQLFCDRNDHFPFYDRGQSCICREPIQSATEKKLRTKLCTGSVYFCNDNLIRFKGNHRMYLAVS